MNSASSMPSSMVQNLPLKPALSSMEATWASVGQKSMASPSSRLLPRRLLQAYRILLSSIHLPLVYPPALRSIPTAATTRSLFLTVVCQRTYRPPLLKFALPQIRKQRVRTWHSSRTTSAMKICLRYKSIPHSMVWNWTSVPEIWYSRTRSTMSRNLSTAKFIRSALLGTAPVASGLFTSTDSSLKAETVWHSVKRSTQPRANSSLVMSRMVSTPTPPLIQPKLYQELILKRVSSTTYGLPMKSYKTINTSLT